MHKIFLLIASVGFVLALFISSSRGDVEPIDEPVDDTTGHRRAGDAQPR
jgi:hypothetical protein